MRKGRKKKKGKKATLSQTEMKPDTHVYSYRQFGKYWTGDEMK